MDEGPDAVGVRLGGEVRAQAVGERLLGGAVGLGERAQARKPGIGLAQPLEPHAEIARVLLRQRRAGGGERALQARGAGLAHADVEDDRHQTLRSSALSRKTLSRPDSAAAVGHSRSMRWNTVPSPAIGSFGQG